MTNYFRNRDFMLDTQYTILIITIIHQNDSHQQLMSVYLKSFFHLLFSTESEVIRWQNVCFLLYID